MSVEDVKREVGRGARLIGEASFAAVESGLSDMSPGLARIKELLDEAQLIANAERARLTETTGHITAIKDKISAGLGTLAAVLDAAGSAADKIMTGAAGLDGAADRELRYAEFLRDPFDKLLERLGDSAVLASTVEMQARPAILTAREAQVRQIQAIEAAMAYAESLGTR